MPTPSFINIIIRERGIDLFLIISFILPLVDVVPGWFRWFLMILKGVLLMICKHAFIMHWVLYVMGYKQQY